MRLIGSLTDVDQVRRFSAYLFTQGIQNHVDRVDEQFEIWVKDEDQLAESKACLEEFLANPQDAKYQVAVQQADSLARQQARQRQQSQKF